MFPLEQFVNSPALIDGDEERVVTYGELKSSSENMRSLAIPHRSLIFIFCSNRIEEVITYVGAINAGHVVCLLDSNMHEAFKQQLGELYSPQYIFDSSDTPWKGYDKIDSPWEPVKAYKNRSQAIPKLHAKLQLLLTTSGTTGNPKLIRLSRNNILSNAKSIIEYLKIDSSERAIATLPFHYSYGLSVLNTHLLAGASIVVTQSSVAQKPLWEIFQRYECTSLAGVPYTYKIMDRLGFDQLSLPSLRTLTQAGGRLDSSLVVKFHKLMHSKGKSFFVMYGQTEATARIAYLPPKYLPEKSEAIGIAIPNGKLKIYNDNKEMTSSFEEGELVYEGPNVMLGYAASIEDLNKDDELHGVLRTGDLGYFDDAGIFFVSGRLKRISKVYGLRINLDDIEKELSRYGIVAVTTTDTLITIYLEGGTLEDCDRCVQHLVEVYELHPSTFRCLSIPKLPRLSSGKIDYQQLI